MSSRSVPLVLAVDDDQETLNLIEHLLKKNDCNAATALSGTAAIEYLRTNKPNLILLDTTMPEMDGYETCRRLQGNSITADIPIVFVTDTAEEGTHAKVISLGGSDYIEKPISEQTLMDKIDQHAKTGSQQGAPATQRPQGAAGSFADYQRFRQYLATQLNLSEDLKSILSSTGHSSIYSISEDLGIDSKLMAQYIANFLDLPYVYHVDPETLLEEGLPAPFCKANGVLSVNDERAGATFVLSNPFNLELIDSLEKLRKKDTPARLIITQPESIDAILKTDVGGDKVESVVDIADWEDETEDAGEHDHEEECEAVLKSADQELVIKPSTQFFDASPVNYIANNIMYAAVSDRASDIHIEPKKEGTVVRFRIDGDMRDMFTLKKKTGLRLISKFKVIGGLDISERRKPQDGTLEAVINDRRFKLRLATTSTPDGESMIVRLLDPSAKPKRLGELGIADDQAQILRSLTQQPTGFILIVGGTGSGKTTTVYSLVSQIDCKTRSLVSIEDPVEYRIPYANQQQVNEKAGVTFDSLLKSVVRQDPDIIFLGEIRDSHSAKMSMDFASTGHLTISTLHTTNATTAIFRLERLGIDRSVMAEAILCVVAQRLLKKLCQHCRKVSPPTEEEMEMLAPFATKLPELVANPVGCPKCGNTGYYGRQAVYEVLRFDPEVSEMVRSGRSILDIRDLVLGRGGVLISDHAIDRVKSLTFSPADVHKRVLLEEIKVARETSRPKERPKGLQHTMAEPDHADGKPKSILIVDDDRDIQSLIGTFLSNRGYDVTRAEDGVEALMSLAKGKYDLIISDVNMPNLDGFKLLEMINQKGIEAPVIFLTARTETEAEVKGLELGAVDYIKKPIQKEILLLRIKSYFEKKRTKSTVEAA